MTNTEPPKDNNILKAKNTEITIAKSLLDFQNLIQY